MIWVELARSRECSAGYFVDQDHEHYIEEMPRGLLEIALDSERSIRESTAFYLQAIQKWNKLYPTGHPKDDIRYNRTLDELYGILSEFECSGVKIKMMTLGQASFLILAFVLHSRPEFDGIPYGINESPENPEELDIEEDLNMVNAIETAWHIVTAANPKLLAANQSIPFVPSPFQRSILSALDGKAMRTDAIAKRLGDRRKFFREKKELENLNLVANHPKLGFYRPDALPPELKPK